jgi:hypothetical protein
VTPDPGDVAYLVLVDRAVPYLLAKVRWPYVAQAISANYCDWLEDPGLFDLPYNRSAVWVSSTQAASVAAGWGGQINAGPAEGAPRFIRRMPANWSDLSPVERQAWGIESGGRRSLSARRVRRLRSFQAKIAADSAAANSYGGPEQRRHTRVRLDGRAYIRSGHTTISAGLVDLSESGVRCVLPEPAQVVPRGARLGGPFLLEAEVIPSRICLNVPGQVSWYRVTPSGIHFGIVFGQVTDGETDGIQRFLTTASKRRGRR